MNRRCAGGASGGAKKGGGNSVGGSSASSIGSRFVQNEAERTQYATMSATPFSQ